MIDNTMIMNNFAGTARKRRDTATTVQTDAVDTANPADARELFLQLLIPVKKHLYNFIQKSLNFSHEADDIFQDALLKGFKYFHSFDRKKNFKTWIFTIAHNLVKDHFAGQSILLMDDVDRLPTDNETSIPEDVREIYAVAAKLKPRHREVFFLYYYNEFKVTEIAAITGLTKVNVKFILHQARKTIKNLLEVPNDKEKK